MEILKAMPNGGAVIALIAVVILFLKKQDRTDQMLGEITARFAAEVQSDRQAFQSQLAALMERSEVSQRLYMDQIKAIVGDYAILTRENITAVRELQRIVRGKPPPKTPA